MPAGRLSTPAPTMLLTRLKVRFVIEAPSFPPASFPSAAAVAAVWSLVGTLATVVRGGAAKDPAALPAVGMEKDSVGAHDVATSKVIKDNDLIAAIERSRFRVFRQI